MSIEHCDLLANVQISDQTYSFVEQQRQKIDKLPEIPGIPGISKGQGQSQPICWTIQTKVAGRRSLLTLSP
jgi:hypothetical protein